MKPTERVERDFAKVGRSTSKVCAHPDGQIQKVGANLVLNRVKHMKIQRVEQLKITRRG